MDSNRLARNLAQSLTSGPWSREFLRQTLRRRLPAQLQSLSDGLGEDIVRALPFTYAPVVSVVADQLEQSEAFEKILLYCRQHDVWPDPDLSLPQMAPIRSFAALDLPALPTVSALADCLFMPISRVEYLADPVSRHEEHKDAPVGHYHYILRPKTSGGLRLIEAPKSQLKSAQRVILDRILSKVAVHADAFGFVKGRNCVKAASRHVGEQVVLNFDLQNFFPSVEAARVFGLFRCLGYPHAVARMLTGLCTTTTPVRILSGLDAAQRATHRRPHLPQGSPASPSLANLAAFPLDRRLSGMAKSLGMNYSRYADDLTFSGDRDATATMMRAVPEIIEDEGFRLNGAKTRVASRTCRQTVTGIIVNDRLNVDRRNFDHLKAVIHACGRSDDSRIDDADFRSSLLGKIAWVESVHPAKGQKLLDLLSTAIAKRTCVHKK